MSERIIITGSEGTVGTVLKTGLKDCEITGLDLPNFDVRDYQKLLSIFSGHSCVIHLAWDAKIDNVATENINPENALMFFNVYKASIESGVPRVIMASTVNADDFTNWGGSGLLPVGRPPLPNSPYGAHKLFMEFLGRYFANKGLEVICVRLGAVNPQNVPPDDKWGEVVWLSHNDLCGLIRRCLEVKKIPNNFLVIYAVSNNTKRIHDVTNPLGWIPKDNADNFLTEGKS